MRSFGFFSSCPTSGSLGQQQRGVPGLQPSWLDPSWLAPIRLALNQAIWDQVSSCKETEAGLHHFLAPHGDVFADGACRHGAAGEPPSGIWRTRWKWRQRSDVSCRSSTRTPAASEYAVVFVAGMGLCLGFVSTGQQLHFGRMIVCQRRQRNQSRRGLATIHGGSASDMVRSKELGCVSRSPVSGMLRSCEPSEHWQQVG